MNASGLKHQDATDSAGMGAHEAGPVDGKLLRNVCGLFVTGVTVITSGTDDTADGATVNSFTSVSLEPPMVLFCLHKDSRLRPVVQKTGAYAVNFLSGRQERLARAFAARDTAAIDAVGSHPSATGVPVLSEALAFLSCRLIEEIEAGDHVIFLAEVAELGTLRQHRDPLIFFRGALGALEDEPVTSHHIWDG